jgi:short-subunit dehydrogenase
MKYTLITGATSGIGKALAFRMAKENRNLILVARSENKLKEVSDSIINQYPIDVITLLADLSDIDQVKASYNKTKNYDIDLWINNAGLGDYSLAWETNIDKAIDMVNVNVTALMHYSLSFVRDYQDKEAILLNVSSGGGYHVFNKAVTYCASKFFVSAFSEGIAQNLALHEKKLRVKILAPGGTNTNFVASSEAGATYKGEDIFDISSFMEPETLADYVLELIGSDKVIGIVGRENKFILKDPIFPYGG